MKVPSYADLTSYYILAQHATTEPLVLSSTHHDLTLAISLNDAGEPTFSLVYGTDVTSQETAYNKLFDPKVVE